jgi:hypothetical protein
LIFYILLFVLLTIIMLTQQQFESDLWTRAEKHFPNLCGLPGSWADVTEFFENERNAYQAMFVAQQAKKLLLGDVSGKTLRNRRKRSRASKNKKVLRECELTISLSEQPKETNLSPVKTMVDTDDSKQDSIHDSKEDSTSDCTSDCTQKGMDDRYVIKGDVIMMKNLPPDTNPLILEKITESYCQIKFINLVKDVTGKCKGVGFVGVSNNTEAIKMCSTISNFKYKGHVVTVSIV